MYVRERDRYTAFIGGGSVPSYMYNIFNLFLFLIIIYLIFNYFFIEFVLARAIYMSLLFEAIEA